MPFIFHYKAKNSQSRDVAGIIEAHDKDEGGEYEEYEDETDLGNVYFNYFEVIEYEVE